MIKDMTKGNIQKILWAFTLPMFVSVIFQQLYNIIDSVVAGRFAGKDALAAVGASYPVTMIFMAVAMGYSIGTSVVISQLFGQKSYGEMKTAIHTALISAAVFSVLLSIIGSFACDWIITVLNTPQEIFADASLYLRIYIWGLFFLFLYNVCTGIFTALGDSRTPLYFLIASSLGNIVLDLVFVINFRIGVAGVAWATFLAQGLASVCAMAVLVLRVKHFRTDQAYQWFSGKMLGRISKLAVPSILQQSFISVGNLFIQSLVNSYGTDVVAGYSAALKLNTFAMMTFTALGNAVSSFTAQNVGAGELERVRQGWKCGVRMVLITAIPFLVFYLGFSKFAMGLFVEAKETAVIAEGVRFLRIVSPFYLVVMLKLVCDGLLRGSSAMGCFMVSTFVDLIIRVVLAFILVIPFGSLGIWLSWPVGWVIGTGLALYFYFAGTWKKSLA